jgi:hypothetical protein
MWVEKRDEGKVLAVMPSLDDMFSLKDNDPKLVKERVRIVQAGGIIELRRLETLEPPSTEVTTRAQLTETDGLIIFLSRRDSVNWPNGGLKIERTAIETPLAKNQKFRRELLEAMIPEHGVLVDFSQMMSQRSRPRS